MHGPSGPKKGRVRSPQAYKFPPEQHQLQMPPPCLSIWGFIDKQLYTHKIKQPPPPKKNKQSTTTICSPYPLQSAQRLRWTVYAFLTFLLSRQSNNIRLRWCSKVRPGPRSLSAGSSAKEVCSEVEERGKHKAFGGVNQQKQSPPD